MEWDSWTSSRRGRQGFSEIQSFLLQGTLAYPIVAINLISQLGLENSFGQSITNVEINYKNEIEIVREGC